MVTTYEAVPRATADSIHAGNLNDAEAPTRTSTSHSASNSPQLDDALAVADTTAGCTTDTTGSLALIRCCTDEERELAKKLRRYTFVIDDWEKGSPTTKSLNNETLEVHSVLDAAKPPQQDDEAHDEVTEETKDAKSWSIARYACKAISAFFGSCMGKRVAPPSLPSSVWSRDSSLYDVPAIPCSVMVEVAKRAPLPAILSAMDYTTPEVPSGSETCAKEPVMIQDKASGSDEGNRSVDELSYAHEGEGQGSVIDTSSSPPADMGAVANVWPARLQSLYKVVDGQGQEYGIETEKMPPDSMSVPNAWPTRRRSILVGIGEYDERDLDTRKEPAAVQSNWPTRRQSLHGVTCERCHVSPDHCLCKRRIVSASRWEAGNTGE